MRKEAKKEEFDERVNMEECIICILKKHNETH
jgi:hypothetical protein